MTTTNPAIQKFKNHRWHDTKSRQCIFQIIIKKKDDSLPAVWKTKRDDLESGRLNKTPLGSGVGVRLTSIFVIVSLLGGARRCQFGGNKQAYMENTPGHWRRGLLGKVATRLLGANFKCDGSWRWVISCFRGRY